MICNALQPELAPRGAGRTEPDVPIRSTFIMEITVFKKLIPVLGLLAFVAGPVFAADAPSATTPAASTDSGKSAHKMSTHHTHRHHKKTTKPS